MTWFPTIKQPLVQKMWFLKSTGKSIADIEKEEDKNEEELRRIRNEGRPSMNDRERLEADADADDVSDDDLNASDDW
eukprot:CAMPEP_0185251778 /NCGR_PEP_ID=MMETSP1359-20130426/1102_1 /TAXON_ID=552665 /ORGANISM="Bigelowiella longifila, Strain CCMP242" /LENGTH=76 /DNA_ID=CAMNT_0027833793 /DNA_START=75 /DNA_END=302 /DNA_ORIENTATION=+